MDLLSAGSSRAATRVSVIVPTRNERHNISGLLESIPASVEVVLCDASSDDTVDLARLSRRRNLTVIPAHGCIADARHRGASEAHGDVLVFTDADVTFDPDYWPRLTDALSIWDGVCGPKLSRSGWDRYYRIVAHGQDAVYQKLGIAVASGSNMAMLRDRYFQLGGFRRRLTCNEDTELFLRTGRLGYAIAFYPSLMVWATDHRRLERGATRKSAHSLARNLVIYATCRRARLPRLLRSDCSYWRHSTPQRRSADHDVSSPTAAAV